MRRFASVASGIFACVTGCGDDGQVRMLPDAPVDDAPIDTPAVGMINITAFTRGDSSVAPSTPFANALVVALRKDGSVSGTANTDAQGKASLEIQEGSSVTVVYPENADFDTYAATYVGVKPGDNLTFGDNYYEANATGQTGQMILNFTAVPNVDHYYLYSPCYGGEYLGAGTTSTTISLYSSCQTPTAPIALIAYNNADQVLASVYLPAASYTVGSTVTIANGQWVTQSPTPEYMVSLSGAHPATQGANLRVYGNYGTRFSTNTYTYPGVENGMVTGTVSTPQTATSRTAELRLYRDGTDGEQFYFRTGASPATFDGQTLPWISGMIVSPKTGTVQWLSGAGTYDAGVLQLYWSNYDGKVTRRSYWNVIVPPGQQAFSFDPPAELEAFLPNGESNVNATLQLVDLSSAADYDAARALPEWRMTRVDRSVQLGEEPSAKMATYDVGEGVSFD